MGGGAKRLEQQHARGKLTARERLDAPARRGQLHRDRCVRHASSDRVRPRRGALPRRRRRHRVTGAIDGRLVFVYSQDFTVFGGSLSEAHAEKICKVMDLAVENGAPIIGLSDSGGRAHPGGCRQPRRVRRDLPAQHARVRRRAADVAGDGSVRRWRGVLAGDHRLLDHGRWHELHVRHRAERREDGDPRGDRLRGARRRARAQRDERRRALPRRVGEPQALELARHADRLSAAEQHRPPPRADRVVGAGGRRRRRSTR